LDIAPGFGNAIEGLAHAYLFKGMFDGARDILERYETHEVGNALFIAILTGLGQKDKARITLERLKKEAIENPRKMATAYNGLQDVDLTLEELEKAYSKHQPWLVYLQVDHYYQNLHSNPKFVELIEKIRAEK
jgi:tetratricopeptide (TPR) repeat protein